MRSYLVALILSIILIGMTPAFSQEYTVPQDQEPIVIPNEFIVTFKDSTDLISGELVFEGMEAELQSLQTFTNTNQVFLVKTDENNLSAILSDSRVQAVEPNKLYHLTGFTDGMPHGIKRVLSDLQAGFNDGMDDARPITIAVMDTGIQVDANGVPNNPDMNVVGCFGFGLDGCKDNNGHGSHVAGTIAARDGVDPFGIIGVVEGARIISIKVCPASCPLSDLIQGHDLITSMADEIDVVNMSLGGGGSGPKDCASATGAWHLALCRNYEAGVVIVVAAGNSSTDAVNFIPCSWDATICISAICDRDGTFGGQGPSCPAFGADDQFASFSNFDSSASVIDLACTGVNVASYDKSGNLWRISGTSMASPHCAGIAASTMLENGITCSDSACVETVRQLMLDNAVAQDSPQGYTGYPSGLGDPLGQVAFGQAPPPPPPPDDIHDMVLTDFTASPSTVVQGDVVDLQATISNAGNVDEEKVSIRYRDTLTRTGIDAQFGISITAGQTIIGDMKQWDTTGVILGDHLLRAKVTLTTPDENPFDNDMFMIVTVVEPLDLPAQVAKNTADIKVLKELHGLPTTLGEDGGNLGIIIIIVVVIFGVTITIIVRIGQRPAG